MKYPLAALLALMALPLRAQTEKSFLQHKVEVSVMEEIIPEGGGKKGLRLHVKVTSKEHVINYRDLKLQVLVSGKYGGPKRDLTRSLERMVLNQTVPFHLDAGKTLEWSTPVMSSGRDNPEHANYGVFYQGYAVVVLDPHDKVVGTETNLKPLLDRYRDIRGTPEGDDYRATVLVNR